MQSLQHDKNGIRELYLLYSNSLFSATNVHQISLYVKVGSNVDKWLNDLSAMRILPLGISDENVAQSKNGGKNFEY